MNNPWSAIEKPDSDFNVRLVDDTHPLKLFWGVDARSHYLFAYDAGCEGLPPKKALPSLSGVDVYCSLHGGRGKMVLVLQDNSDWEIFHALCSDLIRATLEVRDEAAASNIILRRLQRWQELLRRTRPGILTPDQIKGLMGELLFLRGPLASAFSTDTAVGAWRGPEGAPQDFSFGEASVEVKCQSGGTKPVVRINSADQLSPQLPFGWLVVYTLARQDTKQPGSTTLNLLVTQIRSALSGSSEVGRERFEDLLYMAGYITREEYDDYLFSVVSVKTYQLLPGFPRITGGDLIAGVESVNYAVRLDACAEFLARPPWWPTDL